MEDWRQRLACVTLQKPSEIAAECPKIYLMPRRRKDGVDVLTAKSKSNPAFGFGAAAVLVALAISFTWLFPHSLLNFGWLIGWIAWALAFVTVVAAFSGLVLEAQRAKRLEGTRSFDQLCQLTWQQFEQLVADIYKIKGYQVKEVGGQNDGGIDLILTDATGATTGVQCKRWKTWRVGSPDIREFVGSLAGIKAPKGIFVTAGSYTPSAVSTATQHGIELVDGDMLLRMLGGANSPALQIQAPQTTSQTPQQRHPINDTAPSCPRCGSPMIRRTAHQGPFVGKDFWGCPSYPRCRGTRQI